MNKILQYVLPLAVCFSLTACVGMQPHSNVRPAWVDNPRISGLKTGLGVAKTHIQGPSAQREVAIQRALKELSQQMGVKVSDATFTSDTFDGQRVNSSLESHTVQEVFNQEVNATVYDEWRDGNTLYILMVAQ